MKLKGKALQLLLQQFKDECTDQATKIDPDDELCWRSLTVGWAIAKMHTPSEANEIATYIRYNTDLA